MFGLPIHVVLGAFSAGMSIPLLWWSISTSKATPSMEHRFRTQTDLREIVLSQSASDRVVRPGFAYFARAARSISPAGFVDRLERKIGYAGMASAWPVERALAVKTMLGGGMGLLFLLQWAADPGNVRLFGASVLLSVVGFVLPDLLFGIIGQKRQEEIGTTLPDVLDQITISVEAGLGFESALAHVANNLETAIGEELRHTLQDIKVGMTRSQAFDSLNQRTDVAELRQFVVALQQAEKLGVPIAKVLRTQSAELRIIRRQKAEENAQKLPVKMILPLVMCILPALIIVVLAPAVFDALDAFS